MNVITGLSLFLFIVNALPIIPYFTREVQWIINSSLTVSEFTIPLNQFLVRWIIFTLITGILYLILRPIDKAFDKKEDKYSISRKHLSFAYLYKSINELEIFLVNDRKEHTITSLKYLKQYIDRSFLNHLFNIGESGRQLYLPKVLSELKKDYNWIQYSQMTDTIINSFNEIEPKIYERIIQRKEIDLVIDIINYLLVYEYILLDKVKVEKLPTNINDNSIASNLMIVAASEKINALSVVEQVKDEVKATTTIDRLNRIGDGLTGIFSHQNLLITFFSWMFLLGLIFMSLIYLGKSVYNINIDSTIYIGAVSGVIIGAITISATIYSKRK
ncbi:MAG TPA: hypothetical protein VFN30_02740 [Chitinophagaceae bacterium]|nr:hypothetical protein [Chitinophagaceae bacterium]